MNMKLAVKTGFAAILIVLAGLAQAAQVQHFTASVEGRITIGPEGQVVAAHFDDADWMDARVREGYLQKISAWRFEPIIENGQAVTATAPMHLRLAAQRDGASRSARFMIEEAIFPSPEEKAEELARLEQADLSKRPTYPAKAARNGLGAWVFVVARLGEAGVPESVAVESVVLTGPNPGAHQTHLAASFRASALTAAEGWRFGHAQPGELVRIPVKYTPPRDAPARLGWEQVFPVAQDIPEWLVLARSAGTPVADLASNGDRQASPMRLLTPVDG